MRNQIWMYSINKSADILLNYYSNSEFIIFINYWKINIEYKSADLTLK